MKYKLLFVSFVASSLITTYPHIAMFIKLCLCVICGIVIWKAITRPVQHRSIREKLSDYFGQILLAVTSAYILRRYIELDTDFELLLAGFVAGLFSYALLRIYRWLTSSHFIEDLKKKFLKK